MPARSKLMMGMQAVLQCCLPRHGLSSEQSASGDSPLPVHGPWSRTDG